MTFRLALAVSCLTATLLAASTARAEDVWTAQGCGAEPSAPSVDASNVDHYNASIDRVSAYEKAARAYNSCVAKEANRDETVISNQARDKIAHVHEGSVAVQKRIAANFTKMTAQLKSAGSKFASH